MTFRSLQHVVDKAMTLGIKRLVVANAQNSEVLLAVNTAYGKNLIHPILVGDQPQIESLAESASVNLSKMEVIHEPDTWKACITSVQLVNEHKADILMKGIVSTSVFMKAILNKDTGIAEKPLLSHIAFFESRYYGKIFSVTDAALNISPDIHEKAGIIKNAVQVYHQLGINNPKVAIICPVETVNPKIGSTIDAALLSVMQDRNQISGCEVDGPLALDNAISETAAEHKGLNSNVAGKADILIVPDLNSGNILYKSLNFLGGAVSAAIVAGAKVPVVLTSRADNERSKFLSIALAAAFESKTSKTTGYEP